jgi:hypothetical protein
MKVYKVLTQKDKWFSGKFDPEILEKDLNVKQTESLVRQLTKDKPKPKTAGQSIQHAFRNIEDKLAESFNTKVHLKHKKNGSGSLYDI